VGDLGRQDDTRHQPYLDSEDEVVEPVFQRRVLG
jgi:hypothetical protein